MTRKEAQMRNWTKFQLMGIKLNSSEGLTPKEEEALAYIKSTISTLLSYWDTRTATLAKRPLKKYKCWCGNRTNKSYIKDGIQVCKTHYNETE